jgi:hypothetical protein
MGSFDLGWIVVGIMGIMGIVGGDGFKGWLWGGRRLHCIRSCCPDLSDGGDVGFEDGRSEFYIGTSPRSPGEGRCCSKLRRVGRLREGDRHNVFDISPLFDA